MLIVGFNFALSSQTEPLNGVDKDYFEVISNMYTFMYQHVKMYVNIILPGEPLGPTGPIKPCGPSGPIGPRSPFCPGRP